jgi:Fe-S-cluster containining protein
MSGPSSRAKKEKNDKTCDGCGAKCCRYIATEIDRPTCKRDYDHVRWFLLHKNVHVFIDHEGGWFLEFVTDCEELDDEHRCAFYEHRPRICRRHGEGEIECEAHDEKGPYRVRFLSAEDFERYLDKRRVKWRWKEK